MILFLNSRLKNNLNSDQEHWNCWWLGLFLLRQWDFWWAKPPVIRHSIHNSIKVEIQFWWRMWTAGLITRSRQWLTCLDLKAWQDLVRRHIPPYHLKSIHLLCACQGQKRWPNRRNSLCTNQWWKCQPNRACPSRRNNRKNGEDAGEQKAVVDWWECSSLRVWAMLKISAEQA